MVTYKLAQPGLMQFRVMSIIFSLNHNHISSFTTGMIFLQTNTEVTAALISVCELQFFKALKEWFFRRNPMYEVAILRNMFYLMRLQSWQPKKLTGGN